MTVQTLFLVVGGNTLYLIDRLRNVAPSPPIFIEGVAVTVEVEDSDGNTILATTTLDNVGGNTNGRYQKSVADPGFVADRVYTVIIKAPTFEGRRSMTARPFSF